MTQSNIDYNLLFKALNPYDHIGIEKESGIHIVFNYAANKFQFFREIDSINDPGAVLIHGFVLKEVTI